MSSANQTDVNGGSSVGQNSVADALNRSSFNLFHLKALFASGMGFFTCAYDLFIIGTALVLMKDEWQLSSSMVGLIGSISLIATFVGAFVFGRLADTLGRKSIYGLEAVLMTIGAILSAFSPNVAVLLISRVILGLGIGGDYPLSATLMSEYSNTKSRGRLVSMVFSAQALGLVIGPVVALTLLAAGVNHDLAWRLMLGLGALPAFSVIYLRRTLPESPRWVARVKGDSQKASRELASFSLGTAVAQTKDKVIKAPLSKYILTLIATAGTWFVFDFAYYGNAISTPLIMKAIVPNANILTSTAMSLILFAVAAVPGYILALLTVDKIGHKNLQVIGFALMGAMFLLIGVIPVIVQTVSLFLIVYGLSYFFAEFGANTTTFLLAAEVFPVNLRTTGHGYSAGFAKIGAFIGAFLFPVIMKSLGLSNTLILTAGFSVVGILLTVAFLKEPAGKSLEEASGEDAHAVKVVNA